MMLAKTTIDRANRAVQSNPLRYLHEWLYGGKVHGNEFKCGDLSGQPGNSLSINITTGVWCDFATGDKGGDFVDLYQKIYDIAGPVIAARAILKEEPRENKNKPRPLHPRDDTTYTSGQVEDVLSVPPKDHVRPSFYNGSYGDPVQTYDYLDADAFVIFYIARYEKDGKKTFLPFTWSQSRLRFVHKHFPKPRPLYGLEFLKSYPEDTSIILVEGEKACHSLRAICKDKKIIPMTWPGGTNGIDYVDFNPIKGRKVLLWPDNDEPGIKCMQALYYKLKALNIDNPVDVKIINVSDRPDKWDAADALEGGMEFPEFKDWAKKNSYEPNIEPKRPSLPAVILEHPEEEITVSPVPDAIKINDIVVEISNIDHMATDIPDQIRELWAMMRLQLYKTSGEPINNFVNVISFLETLDDFKDKIQYDEFYGRIIIEYPGRPKRFIHDKDYLYIARYLMKVMRFSKCKHSDIRLGIQQFAYENSVNAPKDYFNSLHWDGESRLERFLIDAMGAEDNEYTRKVSLNWFISMVARIDKPGCKVDNMVILEGKQGIKKSTALMTLVNPDWVYECNHSIGSVEFVKSIKGKLIVEIAELDAFSKQDFNTIKKVVSTRVDRYRDSYGIENNDHPRTCVFVGTTNDDDYLRDATGSRRFWPIKCADIDLDYIEENRENLWAEAVHLYKSGQTWWEVPGMAKTVQDERREADLWEHIITDYLDKCVGRHTFSTHEIATKALELTVKDLNKQASNRIGYCMKSLGYEYTKIWDRTKKRARRLWQLEGHVEPEQGNLPGVDSDTSGTSSFSSTPDKASMNGSGLHKKEIKNYAPNAQQRSLN